MLAISTDKLDTQSKWKQSLGAPYPFIPDNDASIVKAYGVKTPLLKFAKRVSFVIGPDQHIKRIDTGRDAMDPTKAMQAC